MQKTFEAVYENGVLRPLEKLAISNMQHVLVTILEIPATGADVAGYFNPDEWEAAKHDDIGLDEARHVLTPIPGSLADTLIASREERSRPLRPRHQCTAQALPSGTRFGSC